MRHTINSIRQLPNRSLTYGRSIPGRLLDEITKTWFRFSWLLSSIVWLLVFTPFLGRSGGMSTMEGILLTPLAGLALLLWIKGILFLCSFMPVAGPICGFARLAYYRAFSSFVAQPAPTFQIPLWFH
jgi:hypothetical protein